MTKEELLEHKIIIADTFDRKKLKYYCDLGYTLLFKYRNNPKLCLAKFSNSEFSQKLKKLRDRYALINEEYINSFTLFFHNNHLAYKNDKGYTCIIFPHLLSYKY